MNRRLAIILFCVALSPATQSAAAPRAICEKYARDAVASQKQHLARRCELKGDPWSLNEANHFNWCLNEGTSALQRENRNRSSHLDMCDRCAEYAHAAVDAQKSNLRRVCGLSGNLWSENERDHYRWCTRVEKGTRVEKMSAGRYERQRDELLKACRQ